MLLSFNKCSISALPVHIYQENRVNTIIGEKSNISPLLWLQLRCAPPIIFFGLYTFRTTYSQLWVRYLDLRHTVKLFSHYQENKSVQ